MNGKVKVKPEGNDWKNFEQRKRKKSKRKRRVREEFKRKFVR
jgi:hypothetical protein